MREAGFSSTAVKNNIEENFSNFSSSPVFNCYSSNGGVYSSPPSPPDHQIPNNLSFWQNSFWKQKLGQTVPFLFPAARAASPGQNTEDIKLILEVLLKKKRKNVVIVSDSVTSTEGLVSETMNRIEKGDVPEELKTTHFIKFQFSSIPLRYMKRDEVELNVAELKRKVDSFLAMGKGVIVYTGDLKWTLDHESESGFGYNPVDHLVADIGRLISDCNNNGTDLVNNKGRVWLMGTANYQTYMKCQMKQPSLEIQWCLQAVSVPTSGLGLSLHATSVQDSRITLSHNLSQAVIDTKPICIKEGNDKVTCCDECTSKYEKEAAATFINSDLDKSSKQLPPWLQSHTTDKQKDDLEELKRKWNRFCPNQHQGKPLFNHRSLSSEKSCTYFTSNDKLDLNAITFANSNPKPAQSTSSYPRFRRQQSCHIDNGNNENQVSETNLVSLKNAEEKDVKITLALGNSLISKSGNLVEKKNEVLGVLKDNVPWQGENVSIILEALVEESKLGMNKNWLLIEGNDFVGKRRLALGIAESAFGCADFLLHMNMKKENERNMFSETLGKALLDRENLVVLVENVDLADPQLLKFLSNEFESGNMGKSRQIIFILTKDDSSSYEDVNDLNCVIQMKLEVSENISDSVNKRKVEWDSPNKVKNPRKDETKNLKRPSSNTLDLNMKAEDEEDENVKFLEEIKNKFIFNRDFTEDTMIKDTILAKIKGSFEEVCKSEGYSGCVFGIENKLLEEFLLSAGCFLNSEFEIWLKLVFETSFKNVKIGEKGANTSVRLCLDRKKGSGSDSSGYYMCSCLPKKIEISFLG